ncbi:zinc ribbon domain-containing protein [Paenibacillus segetis]|uniref:DZANK-type domain-containing protein n=1 Tax=Paenibacillus segetis TaxID=1325360 RepID=A0ABQ1Y4F4_9BACL|nr:zinc ribbon domain-containing protein [Paenibacillus segetis]GGH12059.1 hypothetical protein GCM10008013_04280 [Paenibacillus segetis]
MAFFDKLGEKITSTSKDVAKKTKDLTEIAKINMQIGSEEDKLKSKYLEIGKLYYELFNEAPGEQFTNLCEEITASINQIDSSKRQILSIKGVKICTNCGAEVLQDAAFCGSCGVKVEEEIPEESLTVIDAEVEIIVPQIHCSHCDSVINADAAFCGSCGQKVEQV